jgi:hypothetical protein
VTNRARLLTLAALAVLGACGTKSASAPFANLAFPTSVATFRGVTVAHPTADRSGLANPYSPHFAIANEVTNNLTIVDAVTDVVLPAPLPLHGLVYPVPVWPTLVASADLGDGKPDLLVAVSGGDSKLKLLRTWEVDGAVVDAVDLTTTIVALAALPPAAPGGTARIVAALAGEQIAVVTFARSVSPGGETGIHVVGSVTSAPLGFQAVDLAVLPGDGTRVWAATPDTIPVGAGVRGVAGIDVTGTPVLAAALDATARTRRVTAARLAEAIASTTLDATAFAGSAAAPRIYAVLDERDCGFYAPIACGLVALDPTATGGALLPDTTTPVPFQAGFLAPIPFPFALGVATSPPPVLPPDPQQPQYGGSYQAVVTLLGTRATTSVAAAATNDGSVMYVDLGRWELPSHTSIHGTMTASVTPVTPPVGGQWLVLVDHNGATRSHLDPVGLTSSVGLTAGYTPTAQWIVTNEGVLPSLTSRRAEVTATGGTLQLAMQVTDPVAATTTEVVRLFDPVLGVSVGDTVVFDPNLVGTCQAFEATITALVPPATTVPGGAVQIVPRQSSDPAAAGWAQCVSLLASQPSPVRGLRATIRAGGYVLVLGTGQAAIHVGRPRLGVPFQVSWVNEAGENEDALAPLCLLPPAKPWPPSAVDAGNCGYDALGSVTPCRAACQDLVKARLARRIGYLTEAPQTPGPAIAFTLALETALPAPRDLVTVIGTADGRTPLRFLPPNYPPVGNGFVLPFDRSPYIPGAGIRFLAPYTSGIVLDSTPSVLGGNLVGIH